MTAPRVLRRSADWIPCPICYAGVVADYDSAGVPVYRDCMFCHGLGTVPAAVAKEARHGR